MKTSSVQHVMENWCRQEVRWLRGRGGVGGKREGCVGGVTDEARERRGSWSRALWVGILSAGEVGIGGQSGMHAHVSHASVSATMQRPTKWVKGGLNTAPVWSYEWGCRRAADNLKPASTGSFTVLWACQRTAPCLGFEGTEEEGKGGFRLLLTLKVPLTHRITLNLSLHTAAGETIRGEEITWKSWLEPAGDGEANKCIIHDSSPDGEGHQRIVCCYPTSIIIANKCHE